MCFTNVVKSILLLKSNSIIIRLTRIKLSDYTDMSTELETYYTSII